MKNPLVLHAWNTIVDLVEKVHLGEQQRINVHYKDSDIMLHRHTNIGDKKEYSAIYKLVIGDQFFYLHTYLCDKKEIGKQGCRGYYFDKTNAKPIKITKYNKDLSQLKSPTLYNAVIVEA